MLHFLYVFCLYSNNGFIYRLFTGTTIKQSARQSLEKTIVPLPPLAEQKRIVAKLEEILPLCERSYKSLKNERKLGKL